MDIRNIEELIKVLQNSRTEELSVRRGDVSVVIRKGRKARLTTARRMARIDDAEPTAVPDSPSNEQLILAPMVGVFHTVDGIAQAGSRISAGQVVGTIESMKLLNDVVSDVSGTVSEAMVEDGTPVEYGQPLCRIRLEIGDEDESR